MTVLLGTTGAMLGQALEKALRQPVGEALDRLEQQTVSRVRQSARAQGKIIEVFTFDENEFRRELQFAILEAPDEPSSPTERP